MRKVIWLAMLLFACLPGTAQATVQDAANSVTFTCTGSTGPYPFTFSISDPTALDVTQNGTLLASTSYTIAPVNNNYTNGGNVKLNTACPAGGTLLLQRNTPLTQTSVFTDNMPIPYKTFERGLDKLTEIDQDLNVTIENVLNLISSGGTGGGTANGLNRLNISGATLLTSSNFTFSGWGTGATITGITGTDTSFTFTVTAGVSPSINPTVTLNFADGPWTNIYTVNTQWDGGTGNATDIQASNNLASVTLTYLNLPVATKTYTLTAIIIGTANNAPSSLFINPVLMNPVGTQTILGPNQLIVQGPFSATDGITTNLPTGCVQIVSGGVLSSTGQNCGNGINISPVNCAGLLAAITAATTGSGGNIINYPPTDITCSQQIVIPPGKQITFQGSGPNSRLINNFGTDALILVEGSLGASSTTTSAYAPGAISVNVANGSTFSAYQWVEIASVIGDPAYYACPNTAPAGAGGQCNSELVLIDNVSSNTLNLKTSLSNSYGSGATVTMVTPVVLQMKDMTIVNTGMNFPAIKCWYCINSGFENLEIVGGLFTNATHPAIQIGFYHSTLDWVTGGLYGNMDGNLAGGTQSAPFVVAGASSHIQFNHPSVYKYVENAIVESSHDITINGGDYHGCADDCWNTHGDGNYNVTFSGGNYGGIPTNSAYNGICLYVAGGPPFRSGFPDRNVTITGINCHDFGNAGIEVEGTTTPGQEVENVTVTGNTVKNGLKASGVGIVTYGCLGCVTSNNIVQDVAASGMAYEFGYDNSFIATGNEGQQFNSATGTYGLYSTAVNYAAISSNVMRGFTAYDFYTTNSTQASRYFGNIALDGTYYWDSSLTGSVQRWGNLGDTFSANLYGDSPHHATFSGVVPFTNGGANTYFTNTFLKSIKVLSISAINNGTAPSCSTYPTFVVSDGTITTPTLTLNANYVLLNLSGTAYPSNDAISIRQTNTATCTTYPANANFQIEYAEVGN